MNTDTLKALYSGIKGYSIFLTNFLKPTGERSDYILDKDIFNSANLALANQILLGIKEDLIDGTKYSYETGIPQSILDEAVKEIATISQGKYYLGTESFDTPESIIGILRNKIAHGNFKLALEEESFTVELNKTYVSIKIENFTKMIIRILRQFYYDVNKDELKLEVLIPKNSKRNTSFKTKSEMLGYIKGLSNYTFTLKSLDGKELDKKIIDSTLKIIASFEENKNLNVLNKYQEIIKNRYSLSWTSKKIDERIANAAAQEVSIIMPSDIPYETQTGFLRNFAAKHMNNEQNTNLVTSLFKNFMLLDTVYKAQTIDPQKIRMGFVTGYGNTRIGYEEIASASIVLFETLFCYGNEHFLENKNEYTNLENTGLDYSLLNLDKLNILYYEDNNTLKKTILEEYIGKQNELNKINEKINENENNLEKVKISNNQKAIENINNILNDLYKKRTDLINKLSILYENLNLINNYEIANNNHLKNKNIIDGIRNSISHGNYYIYQKGSQKEQMLVFTDIYEDRVTFKCEVDIIDFINMIYENDYLINEFIKEENLCL